MAIPPEAPTDGTRPAAPATEARARARTGSPARPASERPPPEDLPLHVRQAAARVRGERPPPDAPSRRGFSDLSSSAGRIAAAIDAIENGRTPPPAPRRPSPPERAAPRRVARTLALAALPVAGFALGAIWAGFDESDEAPPLAYGMAAQQGALAGAGPETREVIDGTGGPELLGAGAETPPDRAANAGTPAAATSAAEADAAPPIPSETASRTEAGAAAPADVPARSETSAAAPQAVRSAGDAAPAPAVDDEAPERAEATLPDPDDAATAAPTAESEASPAETDGAFRTAALSPAPAAADDPPGRADAGATAPASASAYAAALAALDPAEAEALALAPSEAEPAAAPGPSVPTDPADAPPPPDPETAERSMDLSRAERREVQIRLSLAGQDPGPHDGVFGDRTREAMTGWQRANGHAATGFLTPASRDALRAATEEAYAERPVPARRPATVVPTPRPSSAAASQEHGCSRGADGDVLPGQGFACDLALLREDLFGR